MPALWQEKAVSMHYAYNMMSDGGNLFRVARIHGVAAAMDAWRALHGFGRPVLHWSKSQHKLICGGWLRWK